MLHLNKTIDQLAKTNSVRWYGNVLSKAKNNILCRALDFKVNWTMKRGRPKKTWLKAIVEQSKNVGLNEVMPITVQDGDYELILFLA